jgi:hypothetical protein
MRANRLLGASMVEANLVKIDSLEAANERLLELIGAGDYKKGSVLSVLAYELQVVKEFDVIQHVMDDHGVGLVDLRAYETPDDLRATIDMGACWATWTLPFDREDDVSFVATAYYLSPAVRTFWEKQFNGSVVWYATTLEILADTFEKIEASRSTKPAAAK